MHKDASLGEECDTCTCWGASDGCAGTTTKGTSMVDHGVAGNTTAAGTSPGHLRLARTLLETAEQTSNCN